MTPFKRAYFSFGELTDCTKHREYNAWHQLDHRPENLALPGMFYGERFVCSPDCAQARMQADPLFENLHYVTCYLFLEPLEQTLRDFFDLGERTTQLGRGPGFPYVKRMMVGKFVPAKGYANPRVLVSPEAVIHRPSRGIFLHVWDFTEPGSADAEEIAAWYDQVHIPDILTCKGMVGAWTFNSDPSPNPPRPPMPAGRRIHLYFLDEDPVEVVAEIRARTPEWRAAGRLRDNSRSKRDLFLGPLRTIVPWQWDWFD